MIALLPWWSETAEQARRWQSEFKLIVASARSSATIELELFVGELKAEIDVVISCDFIVTEWNFDRNLVTVNQPVLVFLKLHCDREDLLTGGRGMKPRNGDEILKTRFSGAISRTSMNRDFDKQLRFDSANGMIAGTHEVSDLGTEVDVSNIAARAVAEFRHTLRMSEQEKIWARRVQFLLVDEIIAVSGADDETVSLKFTRHGPVIAETSGIQPLP